MPLKEKVYSILVVSNSDSFNRAIRNLIPPSFPLVIADNMAQAKRTFSEQSFDIVIINSPLASSTGKRFAYDCVMSPTTVVLFLCPQETYNEVAQELIRNGIFVLSKPVSKTSMIHALSWLESARERIEGIRKKTSSLQDKMEEIRIVNRAKLLLISEEYMSEEEAHRHIEKHAMDLCITKRQAAENIIRRYK